MLIPNTEEIIVSIKNIILSISPNDKEFNPDLMRVNAPFTHTTVNFCSKMIKYQCIFNLGGRNRKNFLADCSASLVEIENSIFWSSGVEILFESIALSILAEGGSYSYNVNSTNQVDEWLFKLSEEKKFMDLEDISIDNPGIYVPLANDFNLVDGILILSDRRIFAIHVRVNSEHSFANSAHRKLLDNFGKFELIHVVPKKIFDAYRVIT